MRAEIERLQRYQEHSMRVLEALASNHQSANILEQLQNGARIETVAKSLGPSASSSYSTFTDFLPQDTISRPSLSRLSSAHRSTSSTTNASGFASSLQRSPVDPNSLHDDLRPLHDVELARNFGQQVILGDEFDSQDPLSHHGPRYANESWTMVTSDGALVEHLLALYFCWEYPIFATVSKEHFIEDFRKRRSRYCSSLLVNALLALACRFSDQPNTRSRSDDPTTAGDHFFAEALRLLKEEHDHHVLTTIQALGVMSIREASCGRISESNFLSAQSMRLAIEMGLHLDGPSPDDGNDTEKAVRAATFWGALSLNE